VALGARLMSGRRGRLLLSMAIATALLERSAVRLVTVGALGMPGRGMLVHPRVTRRTVGF
jgi:hypothetical protein